MTEIKEKKKKAGSLGNRRQSRDRMHIQTFKDLLAGQAERLKWDLSEQFQKRFIAFVSPSTQSPLGGA